MPGTPRDKTYLESKFQTGDKPTQQDFYDLFASFVHYLQIKQESGTSTTDVMSQKAVSDLLMNYIKSNGDTTLTEHSTVDGASIKDFKILNIRDLFINTKRAFVVECVVGGIQASITIDSAMLQLSGISSLGDSTLGMGGGVLIVQSNQAEPAIDDVTSEFLVSYDLASYINKKGNGFFTNTAGWLSASAGLDVADQSGRSFIIKDQLIVYALLASPAFTGTPTAPTASNGTNSTQIATTAFVSAAIANLIASAPGALDTLNELAAAMGNDPNFAATITNALALKANLASPSFTGTPTAPTASNGTNNTQLATTAFVVAAINGITIPDATSLVKGIAKLYNAVGSQTDGGLTPGAVQAAGYAVGASSSVDFAIAIYDGTTGKLLKVAPVKIENNTIKIGTDNTQTRTISAEGIQTDIELSLQPKGRYGVTVKSTSSTSGYIYMVHSDIVSRVSGGNGTLPFIVSGQTQPAGNAAPALYLFGGSGETSNDSGAPALISGSTPPAGGSGKNSNIAFGLLPANWRNMEFGAFWANAIAAPSGGNPANGVFMWGSSNGFNFKNAAGVTVDIFNLIIYSPAYNATITFDQDKDIYSDQTGNAVTLTLSATGAVDNKGTILRLNKPASVAFAGISSEAHPDSQPFDSTKINQIVMMYKANWGGAGVAKVIYSNTCFAGI